MEINLDSSLMEEFIKRKAGPKAYSVVKAIKKEISEEQAKENEEKLENRSRADKEGKTDEEIQNETDIDDINQIRSVLNRLHYLGIIKYDKEKAKKSNWYTYTWSLRRDRIKELLKKRYEEELEELEKELEMEKNYVFFECKNGCEKHPFEVAYEYSFKCPLCDEQMDKTDKNQEKEIKEKIKEIKEFLGKENGSN